MKLERFNKNKKRNGLVVGSIIGILLIVGSLTLLRTFAFYEEKKEFNVLQGQIPKFVENDITLAIRMNGEITESIPVKGDYNVEIKCDNAIGVWNYTKWKIDISEFSGEKVKCSLNFIDDTANSNNLSYKVEIGDYVSMTPIATTFVIPSNLTGYESNQEINPSELNIWRVIKIYDDGTMDLVSEYVSSTGVYFNGKTGYQNYIGTLNMIASSYGNSNYTMNTRYIGFNGQTQYITNVSKINSSIPWELGTVRNEELGGGDILYKKDTELVKNACGNTLKAKRKFENIESIYWLGFRNSAGGDTYWRFEIGAVEIDGKIVTKDLFDSNEIKISVNYFLRPIITLKPNIQILSGDGKSEMTAYQLS